MSMTVSVSVLQQHWSSSRPYDGAAASLWGTGYHCSGVLVAMGWHRVSVPP